MAAKDQITNKNQGSVAFYVTFCAIVAYMVRMVDYDSNIVAITLFYSALLFWFLFIGFAAFYTGKSISGHTYRGMPDATEWIKFKGLVQSDADAIKHYNATYNQNEPYINVEETVADEISDLMARCVDFNSDVNLIRQTGYTKSIGLLIKSIFPLLFSSALFVGFDMDASSPRKENPNQGTEIARTIERIAPKTVNSPASATSTPGESK